MSVRRLVINIALVLLIYIIAMLFAALVAYTTGWSEERALRFTLSIFISMLVVVLNGDS